MKKTVYIAIIGLLFGSCNDFLDKNPDNRASLDSPDNIAGLLASAYPQYSYNWFTEVMSDNATDVGTTAAVDDANIRQMYYWERVTDDFQDTPDGYWYASYSAIACANHALQALDELGKSESYSKAELNPIRGEALLCRAYAHFILVNLFAEHFDPAKAASTPGIPYITQPETLPFVDYERQSVAEVYALIDKDIQEGFPLISEELFKDTPKWHFNRKAAATFLSRFYLYRGLPDDWDKVIEYAGIALEDNPGSFLRDWLTTSTSSDEVFGTNYSRSTNVANFLIVSTVSTATRGWYHRYSMTLDLARKRFANRNLHPLAAYADFVMLNQVLGNTTLGCYFLNKYIEVFKRDGVNANYGIPYVMNTPVVAEEALFNLIEAEIMNENYDEVIRLLNIYYSKRLINYDSSKNAVTDAAINRLYSDTQVSPDVAPHFILTEKQQTYLKCVINIRATEFIAEGQRWFDIKRMHLPVVHSIHNGESITLERNDSRRVIPLPQDVKNLPFEADDESHQIPPAQVYPLTPLNRINE